MHFDFRPLFQRTFAELSRKKPYPQTPATSRGRIKGKANTWGLDVWLSQSLTFGSLAAAFGACTVYLQALYSGSAMGVMQHAMGMPAHVHLCCPSFPLQRAGGWLKRFRLLCSSHVIPHQHQWITCRDRLRVPWHIHFVALLHQFHVGLVIICTICGLHHPERNWDIGRQQKDTMIFPWQSQMHWFIDLIVGEFLRLQKATLGSTSGRCKEVLQDHGIWLTFGSLAATYGAVPFWQGPRAAGGGSP